MAPKSDENTKSTSGKLTVADDCESSEATLGKNSANSNKTATEAAQVLNVLTEIAHNAVVAVEEGVKAVGKAVSDVAVKASYKLEGANDTDLGPYASQGTTAPSDFDPIAGLDLGDTSRDKVKGEGEK